MPADKAPAFQFYPKDFLTDERVKLMSYTERGVYITLLCCCWLEGSLPLETDTLAKLVSLPLVRFTKLWEKSIVRQCFQLQDDGRLHHKRLDIERSKQDTYRARQAAHGAKGGRPKEKATLSSEKGSGFENESQKKVSYLQSSSSERTVPPKKPADPRVKSFLDWFIVEYARRRNGAEYLVNWQRDAPLVKRLLTVVDEPKLRRIAQMLLSSQCNEPFIAETDRGIGILSVKFNWLNERLAKWDADHPRTAEAV